MQNEEIKVPIPPWAKGATNDYTVFGALLPTRDGRSTGNSVVTRVTVTESGVRIMVATEAGNVVGPLNLKEIENLYHRPEFYCEFKEFPGNSGKAWNEFISQEQEEADYRNFEPEIEMPFLDSTTHMDAEVHVMGKGGTPDWMPLSELVEYVCENLPDHGTSNTDPEPNKGWVDISELIINNSPLNKGNPITEYPETMTKDIPAGVYWDMNDGMFKSQISSQIQTDNFHKNWGSKKTMFPTKPYGK